VLGEAGLFGVYIPEEFGGKGHGVFELVLVVEELSRVDGGISLCLAGTALGTYPILLMGNDEQKARYLPALARGEKLAAFALTEADAGSAATDMKMTADRDGDSYVLNGEKMAICQALNLHAAVVFAKTDPDAGFRGVTAFLLPMDLPGITRFPINYIGWKPQGLGGFAMENVRIPEKYRLSEEGKGFYLAMSQFDFLRVGIGLTALGMAQASLEEAMGYAKQRTAFGRPIASFQGISFKLVEDATLVEAGRLLCYRALSMKNQGLMHTKESAMAKWFCPKIATEVIHNCVLALGHFGYTTDYPLAERLRDVVGLEIGDGTPEIMKTILVREMIGKEFV